MEQLGKKTVSAVVVSIPARTTYDLWAYGVVLYEAVAGVPLSPYACRGKRAMSSTEVGKVGQWDENSLRKALKYLDEEDAAIRDLVKHLLHFDSEKRYNTMRQVLEHPFFASTSRSSNTRSTVSRQSRTNSDLVLPQATSTKSLTNSSPSEEGSHRLSSRKSSQRGRDRTSIEIEQHPNREKPSQMHDENVVNGVSKRSSIGGKSNRHNRDSDAASRVSTTSKKSRMFGFRGRKSGKQSVNT